MATPYKSNVTCHICGLPIPFVIVDPRHPLVGTIDHVIPRSRGGKDCAANRAPAHRCCNTHKKSDDLTDGMRESLRQKVLRIFSTANEEIFAALVKHHKARLGQLSKGQQHPESLSAAGLVIANRKPRASFSPNRLRAQNLRMLAGRDADENGRSEETA